MGGIRACASLEFAGDSRRERAGKQIIVNADKRTAELYIYFGMNMRHIYRQ